MNQKNKKSDPKLQNTTHSELKEEPSFRTLSIDKTKKPPHSISPFTHFEMNKNSTTSERSSFPSLKILGVILLLSLSASSIRHLKKNSKNIGTIIQYDHSQHDQMRTAFIEEEKSAIENQLLNDHQLDEVELQFLVERQNHLNQYIAHKNDEKFKSDHAVLMSKVKVTRNNRKKLNRRFAALSSEDSFTQTGAEKNICSPKPPAVVDNMCRVNEPCSVCGGCCCGAEAFRRGLI